MAYQYPPTALLSDAWKQEMTMDETAVEELTELLRDAFDEYELKTVITGHKVTPLAVVYYLEAEEGFSYKTLRNHQQEIEVRLGHYIEILPNPNSELGICISVKAYQRSLVGLRGIIEDPAFHKEGSCLNVAVGMDMAGQPVYLDIAEAPHVLIAGTTGSGKSVFIDDIIISLLYQASPEDVKLILIDPKTVELAPYDSIPHLLMKVITDTDDAFAALAWLEEEMNRRYMLLSEAGVRDINGYNEKADDHMCRIVVIIDEYKEMMDQAEKELNLIIEHLASAARPVGIHLIIATQLAVARVVTPQIKANIPCRVSFTMVDKRETRAVLEQTGSVHLLGSGDLLMSGSDEGSVVHAQAAFVSFEELLDVIWYVKDNNPDI